MMKRMSGWILLALMGAGTALPGEGAVVTLVDGSSYTGIEVRNFEGRDGLFEVIRGERAVQVRKDEIGSIDFEDAIGMVTLADGSAYSGVVIQEFDGSGDRFSVRRGGSSVAIRAHEIASIDFVSDSLRHGAGILVPVVPVEASPAAALEAESPPEPVSAEPKELIAERLRAGALQVPVGDPAEPSEWEISIDAPDDLVERSAPVDPPRRVTAGQWDDEALYSNLPEDFGKVKMAPAPDKDAKPTHYVPRWKETADKTKSAAKTKSARSSEGEAGSARTAKSPAKSRPAVTSRSRTSAGSDRSMANADASTRNSTRSDRSSASTGGGSSSRFGNTGGGNTQGGSAGGGSRFGFDGLGSGGRGGSYGGRGGSYGGGGGSYGGGGGSYGGGGYGGGGYGGGGGGYGNDYGGGGDYGY